MSAVNIAHNMPVRAKVYLYERHFDGFPKEGDLKLVEEVLPPLQNGGKYISLMN